MNTHQQKAAQAAKDGLEYYLRNQVTNQDSADWGRYPFIVTCDTKAVDCLTTNWLTGIQVSVMLNAFQVTQDRKYLDSAKLAVRFLKSLQEFRPWNSRTMGAMHECIPQDLQAHPRDGLSGVMGLLDYSLATGDQDCLQRARAFADWFITTGMEKGYPYWTLRFDDQDWEPHWHGSFHSGSACFLVKMTQVTGDQKYLDAARKLLDFYNQNLLGENGDITVIRQHDTLQKLDDCADPHWAPIGWINMHQYNDDFGALANLACAHATGIQTYAQKARLFLSRMREVQRPNGGFAPESWTETIPNAAGVILVELVNARRMGVIDDSYDPMISRTADYLMGLQFKEEGHPFHGAFHGMTGDYAVDPNQCNARATTYAIMGLMDYAGFVTDNFAVPTQK